MVEAYTYAPLMGVNTRPYKKSYYGGVRGTPL